MQAISQLIILPGRALQSSVIGWRLLQALKDSCHHGMIFRSANFVPEKG